MAHFRIETIHDSQTGLFRCEIYYPDYSLAPCARTEPIYLHHEHAMLDIVEMFKQHLPEKPLKAWPDRCFS